MINPKNLKNSFQPGAGTTIQRLRQIEELAKAGNLTTLEPLLPLCLTLQGKPYTLEHHFPFSPLFRTNLAKTTTVKSGRQVSKSTSIAADGVVRSNAIPYFRTLYVTPLYEQIRRFSNNYVRPFIDRSPIKGLWTGPGTENSVLQRSFKNLSTMIFSFAFLDVDRLRGISTDRIALDEIQDFDPDHVPIIRESMSHSDYGILQMTGTPKTMDNPLEGFWQKSSQAEWFTPCRHCREWNIPSREYHIEKMIGPFHRDISEACPAVVCHKCQKPLFPRDGRWVHKFKDRRKMHAGYHVPQIIMPIHYSRPDKWAELLGKREGAGNTTIATFWNEVLGESVDSGQKLLTRSDLQRAASLPWENVPDNPRPELMQRLRNYEHRVLAIDWGGGGEEGVSFTVAALLGITSSGEVHVLWGKRFVASQEHLREAAELLIWARRFSCDLIVHDYTGAGTVRETVMVQAGFDLNRVMAVQYVRAAAANLIRFVPATVLHDRAHYRLDKTRSLLYTCQAIKLQLVRTFAYDYKDMDNRGLLDDFLALTESKTDSRLAGDIYTITRNILLTDDFAQAVNIGCAAIWHMRGWPNFADAALIQRLNAAQLTDSQLQAAIGNTGTSA